MTDPERLVRRTLVANAALSGLTGLLMVIDAVPLARLFDLAEPIALEVVGAALLPFALGVGWTARRHPLPHPAVAVISALDAAWVAGTVGLALLAPGTFNAIGWAAAALAAVAVDTCCTLQVLGLRRLRARSGAGVVGYAPRHAEHRAA